MAIPGVGLSALEKLRSITHSPQQNDPGLPQSTDAELLKRLEFLQVLPSRNDVWRLDEVVISISSNKHWLWRTGNQDGYVLDEVVQSRCNIKAAKRLLTRLLKRQGAAPKRIITDKLPSYGIAR